MVKDLMEFALLCMWLRLVVFKFQCAENYSSLEDWKSNYINHEVDHID